MKLDDASGPEQGPDPPARFSSWRSFLFVAIAVNALFVWGMWGSVSDPSVAVWTKALSWLPFNVITTVLYYVFMKKLAADSAGSVGSFYVILCLAMIAANWIALFLA
ncbi:MAG: hypothetical protein HGA75_01075 [Thiobacillus sp.]|nr:hypothetical protein [Thiobacillus sp.]